MFRWLTGRDPNVILNHMVKSGSVLDYTFIALADPTRRAILDRLSRGEHSIGDLAAPFRMSLPAVSKHLSMLERAGLVRRRRRGRVRFCALTPRPMKDVADWIARYRQYWESHLDQLARYLETHP